MLFREQLRTLGFRAFLNQHVIVAGLGEVNLQLAKRFHEEGAQVVVIEREDSNALISECHQCGIPTVVGNAADSHLLKRVQLRRCAYVIVSCGRDQIDMDVVKAVRNGLTKRRGEVTVFVHLDDPALWRAVKGLGLAIGHHRDLRLEPFNLLDGAASRLVEETPELHVSRSDTRVVVAADALVGQALALHTARVWLNLGAAPTETRRIDLIGPSAEEQLRALRDRYPKIGQVCVLRAIPIDLESHELAHHATGAAAMLVAYSDESSGLSAALSLRVAAPKCAVTLAVRSGDGGIASATDGTGVRIFAIFSRALGVDFLERGTNEVIARALHQDYVRAQEAKGETAASNSSLVPWEELDETNRQSNRRLADGIAAKLNRVDCAAVPDPLIKVDGPADFDFATSEVEELAILEHQRWVEERRSEGWTFTSGDKDPRNKLHPCLVGWDELSEDNKEKDRQTVRAIPNVLAEAGYRVERVRRIT